MDERTTLINVFKDDNKRKNFVEYLEFLESNTRPSDLNKVMYDILNKDGLLSTVGILNILSDNFYTLTLKYARMKKAQNYIMKNGD